MSLQVWLPLNGDLHNQGLMNIIATNNGATLNDSGKIGKCYSFSGSNSISINTVILPSQTPQWSFSCWFNLNDITTTTAECLFSERGGGGNAKGYTIFLYPSSGQIFIDDGARWSTTPMTYTANTWYHLAITRNAAGKKLYINGQLKSQTTTVGSTTAINNNGCLIGLAQSDSSLTSGNQGWKGKLNDVRIYDHCLSAEEVEEISKGLVLHYKLNNNGMGNENLVNSPITWTELNTKANFNTILTSTTNFGLLAGENFTFSVDIKVPTTIKKARARIQFYNSSSDRTGPTGITYITDGEGRIYVSGTVLANYSRMELLIDWNASSDITTTNVPCYYKNIKLERGTNATVWCPYDNSTIIYDSSGYNNNGTIVGSLETITPSPRYSCATYIPATSSKIHISNFLTSGFSNSYSFAWWGKRNSNSPMFWGFSDGIRLNGMYLGNLWNTGDGSNNPLYKIGTTTQVSVPSVNVWHHYVMVGNGSKCYVYLDGELWAEAKTYKAISGTSIYINGWDAGTSFCSDNTDISDFRIYATALTTEQIKELYNTSMTIDNTGNIHARELVE